MRGQEVDGHNPRRRRASKACIRCNIRKVRCDVSRVPTGTQCTNCRLDDQSCVIRPRARQRRPWYPGCSVNSTPIVLENENFNYSPSQYRKESPVPKTSQQTEKLIQDDSSSTEELGFSPESRNNDLWLPMLERDRPRVGSRSEVVKSKSKLAQALNDTVSPGLDGHLVFSYFKFLKLDQLSSMPPEDARTLESSGCLHVPTKSVLDYFVREYFLHVHPNLPMVDEGQFWKIYTQQEGSYGKPTQFSLFLFQAMLFAASNVSGSKAKDFERDIDFGSSLCHFIFSSDVDFEAYGKLEKRYIEEPR